MKVTLADVMKKASLCVCEKCGELSYLVMHLGRDKDGPLLCSKCFNSLLKEVPKNDK